MLDTSTISQLSIIVGTGCTLLGGLVGYLIKQTRNETSVRTRLEECERKIQVMEDFLYRRGEVAAYLKGVGRKKPS